MKKDSNIRCPNCGANYLSENKEYCEYCGSVFVQKKVSSSVERVPRKTKKNRPKKRVYFVMCFWIIILFGPSIAALLNINTVELFRSVFSPDASDFLSIEVTNVVDYYHEEGSIITAGPGRKYVMVEFTLITLKGVEIEERYFKIETENSFYGGVVTQPSNVENINLKKGVTMYYYIVFEVPEGETPLALVFDNYTYNELSVPFEKSEE